MSIFCHNFNVTVIPQQYFGITLEIIARTEFYGFSAKRECCILIKTAENCRGHFATIVPQIAFAVTNFY